MKIKKSESVSEPDKPLVSVVIPSYNSERHIESCLTSIFSQETALPYEVIVVDSSADATPVIIEEKFPAVKLIRLEKRAYPGAGRNIGVREAQGEIIAFIDSDCVAAEEWLEQGKKAVKKGYDIVGGSVRNANPGLISWADYFLTFNEFMPTMPKREVKFMPTCNFFISKKAFERIGGFRADLLAGEDTLFCHAAGKEHKLLFDPKVQVSHSNRETWKNFIAHHGSFGKHSAQVRKQAELPGSALARKPFLALLAPLARTARISWRMCRYNYRSLLPFAASLPLIVSGAAVWSRGFIKESNN